VKWLLQNSRKRALFALKNPRYTVGSLLRDLALSDEKFIGRITGTSPPRIRAFMDEPVATPQFASLLSTAAETFANLRVESADLFAKKILLQYAAVRALEPELILETGVANGVSSAYLLLALNKNSKGRLHSIGLADPEFLPAGKALGWLVPAWLTERWTLHVGDARNLLPELLPRIGPLDIFIHDSLHTYEHMLWEFQAASPSLRSGGLLIADDALCNTAFADFSRGGRADHAQILRGVGFLKKH
jgi:predicted O-methyltransferase YrrM